MEERRQYLKKGTKVLQELIGQAEEKVAGFKVLKSGIDFKMMTVLDTLNEIRQIVKDNLYSKQRKEGYFIQNEAEYLTCLELEHAKLETLLRQDEKKWTIAAIETKKKAQGIKDEMKLFLEEQ